MELLVKVGPELGPISSTGPSMATDGTPCSSAGLPVGEYVNTSGSLVPSSHEQYTIIQYNRETTGRPFNDVEE